ncbi:hypothetical protein MKEN_01463700 [Mycena kentingensis (nom. inval.)]|nr:hypothetical protein MKEN_01463700 [Mycena kentingensis (nom. inval.)]
MDSSHTKFSSSAGYSTRLATSLANTERFSSLRTEDKTPPKSLGIPLRHHAPEDWNWHFECVRDLKYVESRVILPEYVYGLDTKAYVDTSYVANGPMALRDAHEAEDVVEEIQKTLLVAARGALAAGLREEWAAMAREKKVEVLLQALVRGADIAHDRARYDCPEMTIPALLGELKDERGLIDELQNCVAFDDKGVKKDYFLFPNGKVEKELLAASFAAYGPGFPMHVHPHGESCHHGGGCTHGHWAHSFSNLRMVSRTLFISATLLSVLDIMAGRPARSVEWKEDIQACFECGKSAGALMRCTACSYAIYCSSACQKKNWKAHKPICVEAKAHNLKAKEEEGGATFAESMQFERAWMKWGC